MCDQARRDYQARWIWAKVKAPDPFQFVHFRRIVKLDAAPSDATCFITADTFYRLYVNGRLVMCGPARSSVGHSTVDPVDVTRSLRSGENTILVDALFCNKIEGHMFDAFAQSPGFLCEIEVDGKVVTASDSSWEAAEDMAWNRQAPRFSYQRGWVEDCDARVAIGDWLPAIELGEVGIGPWKTVELRDIPFPAPLDEVRPASVVCVQRSTPGQEFGNWIERLQNERLDADPSAAGNCTALTTNGAGDAVLHGDGAQVTCDFGANQAGFVGFDVTGKSGQVVEIAWNERLADGSVRPHERSGGAQNVLRCTLRDGRQTFLGFNPQLMRYIRVALRGDGDLILHRLTITEFRFAAPAKGDFECSDSGLNKVYESARRTAMLNTLDTFMDCPSRERGAWLHDSYWTAQGVYALFGDLSVNRRMVRQVADSQDFLDPPGMIQALYPSNWTPDRFIPAHALMWVMQAGLEVRWTGETETARQVLPAVRRLMDTFAGWRNAEGLIENAPSWNFLDWCDIRTDGACVGLNAIYARTLDEAAMLERVAGDVAVATKYSRDASKVRASLRTLCGGDLYYPDTLIRDESKRLIPCKERAETTQYYAMWAGIPSVARTKRMWTAMRDDFVPTPEHKVQPIQGLSRGGLFGFPERLLIAADQGDHAAFVRDVRAMFLPMAETPPGTLWEQPWSASSLCHGFMSCVAGMLTEEVLGIRPGPKIMIAPHGGGTLSWCKGYVTLDQGRVDVSWKASKERYELRISLPAGVKAEVRLPDEAKSVWQSGPPKDSWRPRIVAKGQQVITIGPGEVRVK